MGYNKPYNKGIQRVVFHPLYNLNNEGYFFIAHVSVGIP